MLYYFQLWLCQVLVSSYFNLYISDSISYMEQRFGSEEGKQKTNELHSKTADLNKCQITCQSKSLQIQIA